VRPAGAAAIAHILEEERAGARDRQQDLAHHKQKRQAALAATRICMANSRRIYDL
jgi:hypothetical protein